MGIHDARLCIAIQQHDLSLARTHIDRILNINFQCAARHTALHSAVVFNNVEVAALLLQRGADMTIVPLKKVCNESECPLLLAFKKGESHEEMQLLFLETLAHMNWAGFDEAALANIARLSQYALMYSTPRVFFVTKEVNGQNVMNSAGLSPLMFVVRRTGLYEDNVVKCTEMLEKVLMVVDEDPAMAWQRYGVVYNMTKTNENLSAITGCTALGMLAFQIMDDRMDRNRKFMKQIEYRNHVSALYKATLSPGNYFTDTLTTMAEARKVYEEERAVKNRDVMMYFQKEFIPCLFAKMLPLMRLALGMGTHIRLGGHDTCLVATLNPDIMNMIFNALVRDITTSVIGFEHLLC
jgi:hypothetical protein